MSRRSLEGKSPPPGRFLTGGRRVWDRHCRVPSPRDAALGLLLSRPLSGSATGGSAAGGRRSPHRGVRRRARHLTWRLLDCWRRRGRCLFQCVGPTVTRQLQNVVTRAAVRLDKLQLVAKKTLPFYILIMRV
jgi:hypothetical protein